MFSKIFSKSKGPDQKVRDIHNFIISNKGQGLDFWESKGNLHLNDVLIDLTVEDFQDLRDFVVEWDEIEQNILTDCLAYGLDGKFVTQYNQEQRLLIFEIYKQSPNGFKHPDVKKWMKDPKAHSKTQSKNSKLLAIYNYILMNEYRDSDYWYFGGGSLDVQGMLYSYEEQDWAELRNDIPHWNEDQRNILLYAISFGFDGMSDNGLSENQIPAAGAFLLDMFCILEDVDVRQDIAYTAFFIRKSETKQLDKLELMKGWMLENGFNSPEWRNSPLNPLGNIEEAMEWARR